MVCRYPASDWQTYSLMTLVVMTGGGLNAKQKDMAGVSLHAAYGRDTSHFVRVSCQHHPMKQGAGMKDDGTPFHATG